MAASLHTVHPVAARVELFIQQKVMSPLSGARHPKYPALGRLRLASLCPIALALAAAPVLAQTSTSSVNSSALGFSYKLPADWQVASAPSSLPAAKQSAEQSAKKPSEILGIACAQVALSARQSKSHSVVVVAALPFACYGQNMTSQNLSGFSDGVTDGLKQNFNITDPVYGSYTLGTYKFWIERAIGIPQNHPQTEYTLEIACSILKKSAVCWMTLATGAGALRDFEHGLVTLDGEPPVVLVPLNAFLKKSSNSPL